MDWLKEPSNASLLIKTSLQPTESANLRSSLRTFGANIASEET